MPELPEVEVYLDALRSRILGQPLEGARLGSPFLSQLLKKDWPKTLEELEAKKRDSAAG